MVFFSSLTILSPWQQRVSFQGRCILKLKDCLNQHDPNFGLAFSLLLFHSLNSLLILEKLRLFPDFSYTFHFNRAHIIRLAATLALMPPLPAKTASRHRSSLHQVTNAALEPPMPLTGHSYDAARPWPAVARRCCYRQLKPSASPSRPLIGPTSYSFSWPWTPSHEVNSH